MSSARDVECDDNVMSDDKAVLFFEVADLEGTIDAIGRERFVHEAAGWAVLHDPEGHNVLLIQRKSLTET